MRTDYSEIKKSEDSVEMIWRFPNGFTVSVLRQDETDDRPCSNGYNEGMWELGLLDPDDDFPMGSDAEPYDGAGVDARLAQIESYLAYDAPCCGNCKFYKPYPDALEHGALHVCEAPLPFFAAELRYRATTEFDGTDCACFVAVD